MPEESWRCSSTRSMRFVSSFERRNPSHRQQAGVRISSLVGDHVRIGHFWLSPFLPRRWIARVCCIRRSRFFYDGSRPIVRQNRSRPSLSRPLAASSASLFHASASHAPGLLARRWPHGFPRQVSTLSSRPRTCRCAVPSCRFGDGMLAHVRQTLGWGPGQVGSPQGTEPEKDPGVGQFTGVGPQPVPTPATLDRLSWRTGANRSACVQGQARPRPRRTDAKRVREERWMLRRGDTDARPCEGAARMLHAHLVVESRFVTEGCACGLPGQGTDPRRSTLAEGRNGNMFITRN